MSVLSKILEDKRVELAALKNCTTLKQMHRLAENTRPPKSLSRVLTGKRLKLIAEVKKASPSRGLLSTDFDAATLAKLYAQNGASAISVITEKTYFRGAGNGGNRTNKYSSGQNCTRISHYRRSYKQMVENQNKRRYVRGIAGGRSD